MDQSTVPDGSSIRQSCESCRRKKTKCPAEKPICSFCRRLKQNCVYLPRRQKKGAVKETRSTRTKISKHVVRNLESQVGQLYEILDSITVGNDSHARGREDNPSTVSDSKCPEDACVGNVSPHSWSSTRPEPPEEVLEIVYNIYKEKVHFQPLPLFEIQPLRERLASHPPFLRWSLLALTLYHFSHPFFEEQKSKAIEFYTSSSRKVVLDMAFEGEAKPEVLQTLCLLALCDTMKGDHTRAWMIIGNAARLEALRMARYPEIPDEDGYLRCHWSILILEKMFSPQSVLLAQSPRSPDYPRSAPRPRPLDSFGGKSTYGPDLSNAHELHHYDRGINASCLQTISIWGDIMSYIRGIRLGKVDLPWLSTSTHAQHIVSLYELENTLSHEHLLRNVSFADRSPSELSHDKEYWAPWVLMQITSHAAHAVLNNPFVQLVGLRDTNRVSQPRSFLQQTVDQALFHSGWVFRMIKMCEDLEFQIFDPLIAQLVAATATIPWLFQFARDSAVSQSSKTNLDTCERFLGRLASIWPHLKQKLVVLQSLNSLSQREQPENSADRTTITFQPGKLWDLLTFDTNLSWTASSESNMGFFPNTEDLANSATIHVTTKFVHPLADPVESHNHETLVPDFSIQPGENYEELSLDQFLTESMLTDFLGLPNQDDISF